MSLPRSLKIALAIAVVPACSVYGPGLFENVQATGGKSGAGGSGDGGSSTGGASSGGGGKPSGGSGGAAAGGTTTGGAGGTSTGGGSSGGASGSGNGGTNTGGSGGSATGGTVGTGGNGGGETGGMAGAMSTGGTGGTPGCTEPPCLLDDLEHVGTPSYSNSPFSGKWDRYIQTGGAWAVSPLTKMIEERPDDLGTYALHVAATGLDDWGLGVFVTLDGGQPFDITSFSAISFWVRSDSLETSLAVALADDISHQPACGTVADGYCDEHVRYETEIGMLPTWKKFTLPISGFNDPGNLGRTAGLHKTMVYALHFQMDPTAYYDDVDFFIDDIWFE